MLAEVIDREEIPGRVCAIIREALGMQEDEELLPTATFKDYPGIEPTDLWDIKERLGVGFGIEIPHGDLFAQSKDPERWMTFIFPARMNVQDVIDYMFRRLEVEVK